MPLIASPDFTGSMEAWNATAQTLLDLCQHPTAVSAQTLRRPGFSPAGFRYTEGGFTTLGKQELLLLAPDLFVVIYQLELPARQSRVRDGDDLIELQFRLSGGSVREQDGKDVLVPEGTLLICRAPRGSRVRETTLAGGREDVVSVFCNYSYLTRHFGDLATSLRPSAASALSDPGRELCMRITMYPRLAKLAGQILSSHFTTTKRLVHVEAHLLLACCEVLAVLENGQVDCRSSGRLSDQDFAKIHAARDILIARHTPPPSTASIAREVGLSATKLKVGFKALFGKSIFEFGHELRMNLARDLLKQPDRSIQQVAAQVGYEYQHSFTVAFRQQFSVLPKVYRRTPSTGPASGRRADGAADGAYGLLSMET